MFHLALGDGSRLFQSIFTGTGFVSCVVRNTRFHPGVTITNNHNPNVTTAKPKTKTKQNKTACRQQIEETSIAQQTKKYEKKGVWKSQTLVLSTSSDDDIDKRKNVRRRTGKARSQQQHRWGAEGQARVETHCFIFFSVLRAIRASAPNKGRLTRQRSYNQPTNQHATHRIRVPSPRRRNRLDTLLLVLTVCLHRIIIIIPIRSRLCDDGRERRCWWTVGIQVHPPKLIVGNKNVVVGVVVLVVVVDLPKNKPELLPWCICGGVQRGDHDDENEAEEFVIDHLVVEQRGDNPANAVGVPNGNRILDNRFHIMVDLRSLTTGETVRRNRRRPL